METYKIITPSGEVVYAQYERDMAKQLGLSAAPRSRAKAVEPENMGDEPDTPEGDELEAPEGEPDTPETPEGEPENKAQSTRPGAGKRTK